MSNDYGSARDELDAALPRWWAQRRPGSILDQVLEVLTGLADDLGLSLDQIHSDQFMATASQDALRTEWGPLFGADSEDLDDNAGNLRAYLQELSSDDGSTDALIRALVRLLSTPTNLATGDPSLLGLEFPADGSGLEFPADGSGLLFPADGWIAVIEHFASYTMTVQVKGSLVFDRDAFARAVERHRQAHTLPATIEEI